MTEVAATVDGAAVSEPAAPSPETPLSPYQRRKQRERERDEQRAKRRAAREVKKTGTAAGESTLPAGATEPAAVTLERTDEQRAADLATFLAGVVWPVLGLFARLFGFDLSPLALAEAAEDAAAWVPAARRYRWLDLAATWAAAPARLVARVRSHAKRREKKTKEPAT